MKKLIILFFIGFSLLNAIDLDNYINKTNCNQIINKQVFTVCYDYKNKGAKYVAYTLHGELVNYLNIKKRKSFYTEKNLKKEYRSYSKDYRKSGFDRGHLASDASFDYDKKVVRKTYTMINVIPQAPKVNRYTWIKAEKLERLIAVKLGTVNVINGVIYEETPPRIGKNKIAVPSSFWKMIYNDEKNYKKCFLYQNINNIDIKKDKLKQHLVDCDSLIE